MVRRLRSVIGLSAVIVSTRARSECITSIRAGSARAARRNTCRGRRAAGALISRRHLISHKEPVLVALKYWAATQQKAPAAGALIETRRCRPRARLAWSGARSPRPRRGARTCDISNDFC